MLFLQSGLLSRQDTLIGLHMSTSLSTPSVQTSRKYLSDATVHRVKTSGPRFQEVLLPGMCLPK